MRVDSIRVYEVDILLDVPLEDLDLLRVNLDPSKGMLVELELASDMHYLEHK